MTDTATQKPRRLSWLALTPLALFALVAAFMAAGLSNDPRALPSQMIDRTMPDFELKPLSPGEKVLTPADLQGDVSLINIFGSWCVSCLAEHPMLMRLSATEGVKIYGVDWRDPPGAGAAWLKQYGNPYTLAGVDSESRLAIELGVTGAPETFVIDATGRIRYKHVGPITQQVWDETLTPLLEEIAPDKN